MTDFPPPPPPNEPDPWVGPAARGGDDPILDELASALVDGELSPTETARAQANPDVMTRVTAIHAARAQLRAIPPAPPTHADTAIAAALAAAAPAVQPPHLHPVPPPESWQGVGLPPAPPSPVPFDATSASRRTGQHRWLAAAAAVVVVALVAVGVLASGSDEGDDSTAMDSRADADEQVTEAQPESADPAAGSGDGEEADDSGGDAGEAADDPSAAAEAVVVDLGDVTRDDLVPEVTTSLEAGLGDPTTAPDETERANPSCPGLSVFGNSTQGEPIYVADALLDGTEVRIHVYQDVETDSAHLVATDRTCTDVVIEPVAL